tara:strand:- start:277 stop:696 length:420 start_codon:yes stop_codon:yes gene_type:complete
METDDYYEVDEKLKSNSSVACLIKLMWPSYSLKIGESVDVESPSEQRLQRIYVGSPNNVSLGFWPIEGPVERMQGGSRLNELIKKGILSIVTPYDHHHLKDTPMMSLVLTKEKKVLKKQGLEQLLPGHFIHLFLEPKKD